MNSACGKGFGAATFTAPVMSSRSISHRTALGRLLYLVHLAVLLWWLLDKSSKQRATAALVSLTQQILPSATLTLRVPAARRFVISVDELVRDALFGSPVST